MPPRNTARCRERYHTNDFVSHGISCFAAGCIYIDVEGITIGPCSLKFEKEKARFVSR